MSYAEKEDRVYQKLMEERFRKYNREERAMNFDTYFEAVEATVKAHYIAGKISMEEKKIKKIRHLSGVEIQGNLYYNRYQKKTMKMRQGRILS